MTALAIHTENTVPAFPLGQPVDGRERYGMTPAQARLYRWLVANRPHDEAFVFSYRGAGRELGMAESTVHWLVYELIDRGWIEAITQQDRNKPFLWRFVHPVMMFNEPRNG